MKKKIVYIAHPIGGNVIQNLKDIQMIYQFISNEEKVIPFVPYMATVQSLDDSDPKAREKGFEHNKAIFESGIINEMWLYGGRISSGMQTEIDWCKELNIPVIQKF